jgi:hypothetical protein
MRRKLQGGAATNKRILNSVSAGSLGSSLVWVRIRSHILASGGDIDDSGFGGRGIVLGDGHFNALVSDLNGPRFTGPTWRGGTNPLKALDGGKDFGDVFGFDLVSGELQGARVEKRAEGFVHRGDLGVVVETEDVAGDIGRACDPVGEGRILEDLTKAAQGGGADVHPETFRRRGGDFETDIFGAQTFLHEPGGQGGPLDRVELGGEGMSPPAAIADAGRNEIVEAFGRVSWVSLRGIMLQ